MDRQTNPIRRMSALIPKSRSQLESRAMDLLKVVFWAALLGPVVLVPAYYLLVAFGLAPSIHLPG